MTPCAAESLSPARQEILALASSRPRVQNSQGPVFEPPSARCQEAERDPQLSLLSNSSRFERESEMSKVPVGFGLPNEWEAFINENQLLIQKLQILFGTLNTVFVRKNNRTEPVDRVVFYLGRLCAEDLMELLLLCGNGYGLGAFKLLRSMYEKAVTAAYISKNPAKAELFLDYHHIQQWKSLKHFKDGMSEEELRAYFTDAQVKGFEQAAENVKDKFPNRMSWSNLNTLEMAKAAGNGFKDLYYLAYFLPTQQIHSTPVALIERLALTDDGAMDFNSGSQPEMAGQVMITAHNVILLVIDTQNEYFGLKLDDELNQLAADFQTVWKKNE